MPRPCEAPGATALPRGPRPPRLHAARRRSSSERFRRERPRPPDDGRTRQSGNCCENPSPTHLPLPSMYRSLASYNDSSAAIGTPPHFSVLLPSSDSCRLPKLPPWEPPVSSLDVG